MKGWQSGDWTAGLAPGDGESLLRVARDTLAWCVLRPASAFEWRRSALGEGLAQEAATFVTLHAGDRLRGCIGNLVAIESLAFSVHHNAIGAAIRDPRFAPLAPPELAAIRIHVSILSPLMAIDRLEDFAIGRHGIVMEAGSARALFLPEVAVEQGWDRRRTAEALCAKAGLKPDAWRTARFQVFSTVSVSE